MTVSKEAVAKLHDCGKSMILGGFAKDGQSPSERIDGGLPNRAGEEMRLSKPPKGRFYKSKSLRAASKEKLEKVYSSHHERKGRYNYLFCHGERGPYLKEWIGSGKTVLDLGCRDGMLTQFFAKENRVIGVDIDQKALFLAKERLKIETKWLDLNEEWPFPKASFDAIVACEIMEHLFFPSIVLEQIHDSLKPEGLFIGSVPNAFRLRNRWKFLWGEEFDKDPTHVRLFSYEKLKKMLGVHFSEIEILPIRGKILPFWPLRRTFSQLLTTLFAKDLLWKASRGD